MRAVRKLQLGSGHMALCDIPEPEIEKPDQVKIAVRAGGVCGTDLHIRHGGYVFNPPVTLGHEFAGEVVEVGPGVTRIRPGDRVTVLPSALERCGVCRYCRGGYYFFCINRLGVGSRADGGFAEFARVPEELLFVLPDGVDFRVGALAEPLACCVQAVCHYTPIAPGDLVLISGPGPIGLMCAMLAGLSGGRVVICGTAQDQQRLQTARELGVERTVDISQEDVVEVVRQMSDGYGADVVLECAGVGASVNQCLNAVAYLGHYTQIGVIDQPIEVDFGRVVYKQLRVQGSIGQTWRAWDQTMQLLASGQMPLERLITHEVPLEGWEQAFDSVEQKQGLKHILCP